MHFSRVTQWGAGRTGGGTHRGTALDTQRLGGPGRCGGKRLEEGAADQSPVRNVLGACSLPLKPPHPDPAEESRARS